MSDRTLTDADVAAIAAALAAKIKDEVIAELKRLYQIDPAIVGPWHPPK